MRFTIRHCDPVVGIHRIADALRRTITGGSSLFINPDELNLVLTPIVQRRILGWCEQLHLNADLISDGDFRKGVIEQPDSHYDD